MASPPLDMNLFWGNVSEGAPRQGNSAALAAMRRPRPKPPDPDELMRQAIAQKISYVPSVAVDARQLVNMDKLGRLGIRSDNKRRETEGLPYGVHPSSLSEEEKQWMIMQAYKAGMVERGQ